MDRPTVILITGYPATGKTTLAQYLAETLKLPLVCKDDLKELLLDHLPEPPQHATPDAWSRTLGVLSWALLYRQVSLLLRARVSHIVEGNFDPHYSTLRWQALSDSYPLRLVQVRCETAAPVLLARYRARIASGERHPGHVDQSDDPDFHAQVKRGPIEWLALDSERISVDTVANQQEGYAPLAMQIRGMLAGTVCG